MAQLMNQNRKIAKNERQQRDKKAGDGNSQADQQRVLSILRQGWQAGSFMGTSKPVRLLSLGDARCNKLVEIHVTNGATDLRR